MSKSSSSTTFNSQNRRRNHKQSDMSKSSPERLSYFRSASGIVKVQSRNHQLACDRCRGQKLRCIRSSNLQDSCERCQRARATCVMNPTVRMGRPQRVDKGHCDREAAESQNNQRTYISNSPQLGQTSFQTSSADMADTGTLWTGHELKSATDTGLRQAQYQPGHFDFDLNSNVLDAPQLPIPSSEVCFSSIFAISSTPPPQQVGDFGMEEFCLEKRPNSLQQPNGPNSTAVNDNTLLKSTEKVNVLNAADQMSVAHQDLVEKLSSLNLELYRQLRAIRPLARERQPAISNSIPSAEVNKTLSSTIVVMVQSLQNFYGFLTIAADAGNRGAPEGKGCQIDTQRIQNNHPAFSSAAQRIAICRVNNGFEGTISQAKSAAAPINMSWDTQQVTPPSDTLPQVHVQDAATQNHVLDLPTSLLMISCYINVIHLCRDVFAAIRGILPNVGAQMNLVPFSGFQISGVSIQQDADLQFIVLTQTVARLVDRIGHVLERGQASGEMETGMRETGSWTILSPMFHAVSQQEGSGWPALCRKEIEALKEEIRQLNQVVYQPI